MASLDDLKKRIASVKSTQKITKAMKMVAAAKLRRAQESAEKGRPYSEKMNNVILNLSNGISDKENAPKLLSGTGQEKTHLCVVMTSDRGLCGGFNSNIIKKAKSYFAKILDEGKELKIITVGSKGNDQLKRVYGDKIIENISFKEENEVPKLPVPEFLEGNNIEINTEEPEVIALGLILVPEPIIDNSIWLPSIEPVSAVIVKVLLECEAETPATPAVPTPLVA